MIIFNDTFDQLVSMRKDTSINYDNYLEKLYKSKGI